MKKKQRRILKDYFQIGHYIYANTQGKVAVVIPKNTLLTNSKIRKDYHTLISYYGIDMANYYLKCCSDYLNGSHR